MSISSKKLINSPNSCVKEFYEGVAKSYPGLSINTTDRIVLRFHPPDEGGYSNRVGVITGGGSGHEPFGTGYVGRGMLCATVTGSIFTASPASKSFKTIYNVARHYKGGVVVLIPNYTGDVLNFGLAVEIAKDMGYKVESIMVGEDCALVGSEQCAVVGRRGLCGQLFIFKIAGAMSENRANLSDIVKTCREVLTNMASLGVCTSPCSLPGSTEPLFHLGPNEVAVGLGNHGEAGVDMMPLLSANEITKVMLKKISSTLSLKAGDEVCAIINNLGSTTTLEQYIIANEVHKQLGTKDIKVARLYVGTLVTSLEMGGLQISLLQTTDHPEWVKLLDCETEATAWPGRLLSFEKYDLKIEERATFTKKLTGPELQNNEVDVIKRCLFSIADSIKSEEEKLNRLDSGCGDGDCGTTLRHLVEAILQHMDKLPFQRPESCFIELADIASESMGGTSGGIYSLLLRGASRYVPDWAAAWKEALDTVTKYSTAKVGHRTLLDALIPAYNEFSQQIAKEGWKAALQSAVNKAEEGCEATRNLKALCGRASYVNDMYLKDVDAGAYGVTVWLKAIYRELSK